MGPSKLDYNALSLQLLEYRRRQKRLRIERRNRDNKQLYESEIEEQVNAAIIAARALRLQLPHIPETIVLPVSGPAFKRFRQKLQTSPKQPSSSTRPLTYKHHGNTLSLTMPSPQHAEIATFFRDDMLEKLQELTLGHLYANRERHRKSVVTDKKLVICAFIDSSFPTDSGWTTPDFSVYTTFGRYHVPYKVPRFFLEVAVSQQFDDVCEKVLRTIERSSGKIRCGVAIKLDYRKGRLRSPATHVYVIRAVTTEPGMSQAVGDQVKVIDEDGNLCRPGGPGAIEVPIKDILHELRDDEWPPDVDQTGVYRLEDEDLRGCVIEMFETSERNEEEPFFEEEKMVLTAEQHALLNRRSQYQNGYSSDQSDESNKGKEKEKANEVGNNSGSLFEPSSDVSDGSEEYNPKCHSVDVKNEDLERGFRR